VRHVEVGEADEVGPGGGHCPSRPELAHVQRGEVGEGGPLGGEGTWVGERPMSARRGQGMMRKAYSYVQPRLNSTAPSPATPWFGPRSRRVSAVSVLHEEGRSPL
jgi:hypothetical protein